ncbi:MAG: hypothetical protein JNK82_37610 [Myxococcaceae bacterium]|nr:hypothetical protein [Myxococcaceae bacterium]
MLLNDECLGPLLNCGAVVLEVLWFDTASEGVYRWRPSGGGFHLLTNPMAEQLLADVRSR